MEAQVRQELQARSMCHSMSKGMPRSKNQEHKKDKARPDAAKLRCQPENPGFLTYQGGAWGRRNSPTGHARVGAGAEEAAEIIYQGWTSKQPVAMGMDVKWKFETWGWYKAQGLATISKGWKRWALFHENTEEDSTDRLVCYINIYCSYYSYPVLSLCLKLLNISGTNQGVISILLVTDEN